MAKDSLRRRVLLSLGIALAVFFGATVVVLEWSLATSLAQSRDEVLKAQLMALIAMAEPAEPVEPADAPHGLALPEPPDGRMLSPGSGLLAEIRDAHGAVVWRSPSALGVVVELPPAGAPGAYERWIQAEADGPGLALAGITIDWEFEDESVASFRFIVGQSLEPWRAQRRAFRLGLVGWFGALAAAMLFVLAVVLRRVLQPLGRIEQEIHEMETARREQLSAAWPEELRGVAANLNALLRRERARQQRYQESLANLAHSLKTPLAAVRTLLPEGDGLSERIRVIRAELSRMDQIIGWQLRRAGAAGAAGGVGLAPVAVAPVASDLAATLDKVYADRGSSCELDIPAAVRFRGDEGDLQEILGNLLDNAWKYGRGRIRCSAAVTAPGTIELRVEDDGAGLDPERASEAMARGARLDESHPGQGIGLAVVNELVSAYGGSIEVERSPLGGTAVIVTLPGA